METYRLIDMFDSLDTALLEDLHLEKDMKRHQNMIRRMFASGHVRVASIVAGVSLCVTGALILFIQVRRRYDRRTA